LLVGWLVVVVVFFDSRSRAAAINIGFVVIAQQNKTMTFAYKFYNKPNKNLVTSSFHKKKEDENV